MTNKKLYRLSLMVYGEYPSVYSHVRVLTPDLFRGMYFKFRRYLDEKHGIIGFPSHMVALHMRQDEDWISVPITRDMWTKVFSKKTSKKGGGTHKN